MQSHPILAEDFGPLYSCYAVLWLALSVLSVIGLVLGYRGHWAALILSGPPVLISGLMTLSLLQHPSGVLPFFMLTGPVPLLLGLPGLILWFIRRRAMFNPLSLRILLYVCLACASLVIFIIVSTK